MITKWRLFNFKSIREQTELTFKPLTIFAGANSSGKSTVLQSMLLVSQTLGSMVPSRSVVLNGHLTKLGQFDDLVQQGSESQQIAIGWESTPLRPTGQPLEQTRAQNRLLADPTEHLTSISVDFSFDAIGSGGPSDLAQLQPLFYGLNLKCVTRNEEGNDTVSTLTVSRRAEIEFLKLRNELSAQFASGESVSIPPAVAYSVQLDTQTEEKLRRLEVPFEMQGCRLRHFLPERFVGIVHDDEVQGNLILRALKGEGPPRRYANRLRDEANFPIPVEIIALLKDRFKDKPHPILAAPSSIGRARSTPDHPEITLRDCIQRTRYMSPQEQNRIRATIKDLESDISAIISSKGSHAAGWTAIALPTSIRNAVDYTADWFTNDIQYLGPLRDEPKPLYPLAANVDPLDIGLCGEHTAAVLHLHADLPVEYLSSENFRQPAIVLNRSRRSLRFAVLDWLKYMGIATDIETIDKGKLGHELKVRLSETDKVHDLTHVGVGVSQVLPIVVSCLLADPDTTLIFEQPELHLHPKVQTLLGDFFLAMAALGKQCILETHSEYLINRLRFRAASAPRDSLSSVIQLYFVEKNEASNFREVTINQYGAILDWPDGFFDQSQGEAEEILRAATIKRRTEREEAGHGKRNT